MKHPILATAAVLALSGCMTMQAPIRYEQKAAQMLEGGDSALSYASEDLLCQGLHMAARHERYSEHYWVVLEKADERGFLDDKEHGAIFAGNKTIGMSYCAFVAIEGIPWYTRGDITHSTRQNGAPVTVIQKRGPSYRSIYTAYFVDHKLTQFDSHL